MRRLTVTFERFTVARVQFPFTDRSATKNRPALIIWGFARNDSIRNPA